jgi:hypothetical protein
VSIWIILHEYAESVTPRLVECRGKPTQAQAKKLVGKEFKPRAGDTIRVIGPYDPNTIPKIGKRRRREEVVEPEPDTDPFDPFEDEED